MDYSIYNLFQLIEEDKLVRIIENFTKATDITIDINDAMGCPVVQHSFFYGFCHSIRTTTVGLQRCIESNAQLGFETLNLGNSCMCKCHAGVMLRAVSIIVDGEFYGSITCGQMHLAKPEQADIELMLQSTSDLGLNRAELTTTFQEIQVISMEKFQAAAGLIQFVVNYIVELIYRTKMHEELSRKKLKASEDALVIIELENTLNKAELKNLQSQIKPHFLFNTLNTIICLVTLGENDKGLQALFALSNLLRHNLDHSGELVSLREELDYVENYLSIQKNRFCNRLELAIEVPEYLRSAQIPFLSLQPLVENACVHGLEPKEGDGHLWIKCRQLEGKVEIAVIDDGVGLPANWSDFGLNGSELARIGLSNVHQRLQLHFGPNFGIRLTAEHGLTKATLTLPMPQQLVP